jgi:TPR repeat protein
MRKKDIQLLAAARQGDIAARCEIGRRYLTGTNGFPRHLTQGLEHLGHPAVKDSSEAASIVAEHVPLHEILQAGQMGTLRRAAAACSVPAWIKLGVWASLTEETAEPAIGWLAKASEAGSRLASALLEAIERGPRPELGDFVARLSGHRDFDLEALLTDAIGLAMREGQGSLLGRLIDATARLQPSSVSRLPEVVCDALWRAQEFAGFRLTGAAADIEHLLEIGVARGNPSASLLLGRALCGLDERAAQSSSWTLHSNMRKGAALLLRAADAGYGEAWMLLYRVHSDHSASVANPQMARFCLEKGATNGDPVAQRLLGALVLRSASTIEDSERAIHWLHSAAALGDEPARAILRTLVLPVSSEEEHARAVIDAIRSDDPWLAWRLRTARDFGLTRLEALSVDIVAGSRPWGLLVGPNPFVVQAKLAAPRAIPALTSRALTHLHEASVLMRQSRPIGGAFEGDLRQRTVRLRRQLAAHAVTDELFFAQASASRLDVLRRGAKWAFHERDSLREALAA